MKELTETQNKQLNFLASREPYETLTNQPVYWADCKDCGKGAELRSADGARCFILNHTGHRTWIQTGRNERV